MVGNSPQNFSLKKSYLACDWLYDFFTSKQKNRVANRTASHKDTRREIFSNLELNNLDNVISDKVNTIAKVNVSAHAHVCIVCFFFRLFILLQYKSCALGTV